MGPVRAPFCTAILARNELGRYLPEVLDWHGRFGPIVVLDDNSTDGTYEYCRDHPAVAVCERVGGGDGGMWGRETPARMHLWELGRDYADWVLVCDADQLLSADPRPLLATDANAIAFRLYDLWDTRHTYRDDGFWQAHKYPRPWLFNPHRTPRAYRPQWSGRGIHTGHFPADFPLSVLVAPPDEFYWLHMAYVRPEDRAAKLTKYRGQYHQMSDFEKAHAESIATPPTLRILPFAKPIKILVGGPVRKRKEILEAHLTSLGNQELPKRVELTYLFVDDYPTPDPAQRVLAEFVDGRGTVIKNQGSVGGDFADDHPVSHQWTTTAMNRVGAIKNEILRQTLDGGYDYVWLIDTDLVLDRTVLRSLLAAGKPVVSAVYWTRWHTDPSIKAGPQVWLRPPYQLGLPHYPEHEFRHKLGVARKITQVGGLGACTLIARSVIEKGVNFNRPPDWPTGGLWDGEDRYFCEWARRLHVDLWADGWPDIGHIYHPQQVATDMIAWEARLGMSHPFYPNIGHLVSLKLTNLEDGIGPVSVRCRLGDGTLLPELESQVMQMERGQEKIVRIHFPNTVPPIPTQRGVLALANQNRLIQIELVDCKPFSLPPTLEDEYYVSPNGQVQDKTALSDEQHKKIAEAL